MRRENSKSILLEEMDREILSRMPEWFRVLREAYQKRFFRRKIKLDIHGKSSGHARWFNPKT
jgi:hypothetical protein